MTLLVQEMIMIVLLLKWLNDSEIDETLTDSKLIKLIESSNSKHLINKMIDSAYDLNKYLHISLKKIFSTIRKKIYVEWTFNNL